MAFADAEPEHAEEDELDGEHRHAVGPGRLAVDGREEQRPGDEQQPGDDDGRQDDGEARRAGADAEDRAEEDVDPRGAVGSAPGGGVHRQREHPDAEDPGEDAADDHVGAPPAAAVEGAEAEGDGDGRDEETQPWVATGGERDQAAGDGDVAERVPGEDLVAEHDEVTDEAGGDRDRGPGDERGAHEVVGEHRLQATQRRDPGRDHATLQRRRDTASAIPPARATR